MFFFFLRKHIIGNGFELKVNVSKARTEDRISALPDAIIFHILSFLPTSDAVTTCFLSNRWKNMWTLVPNVELIVLSTAWDSGGTAAYVDRYLLFRGSSNIHKFHLCCVDLDSIVGRINGWICTALRRNVVELHLEFDERDDSHEFLVLPQDLFVCKTLETLKLSLGEHVTAVAPPKSNCFPRLKSLHITFDFPKYVEQIEKLFSCCPALEDLVVDGDLGWLEENQVSNVTISAPKLKRPKIYLFAHAMTLGENKIFVNADVPSLEDLDLSENFLASYCLKGAKSLTNAKIDFSVMREEDEGHPADVLADVDRVQRLFAEISNVKHLSLVVPVLGDTHIEYQCSLPTFNHLNQLELNHLACCSWKSLTNMLKITPNLENLLFAVEKESVSSSSAPNRHPIATTRLEVDKFNGSDNFGMWQCKVMYVLYQQELNMVLEDKPEDIDDKQWIRINLHVCASIRSFLDKELKYPYTKETSAKELWKKLEEKYMTKSAENRLFLKKRLFRLQYRLGISMHKHLNDYNKILADLANLDVIIPDEDKALCLLNSLPDDYDHLTTTFVVWKIQGET
ncbi:unnamed protein product [Prunus armeniaca]